MLQAEYERTLNSEIKSESDIEEGYSALMSSSGSEEEEIPEVFVE